MGDFRGRHDRQAGTYNPTNEWTSRSVQHACQKPMSEPSARGNSQNFRPWSSFPSHKRRNVEGHHLVHESKAHRTFIHARRWSSHAFILLGPVSSCRRSETNPETSQTLLSHNTFVHSIAAAHTIAGLIICGCTEMQMIAFLKTAGSLPWHHRSNMRTTQRLLAI